MKHLALMMATGLAAGFLVNPVTPASAGERYGQRPPVVLSPDLSAPWVLQLRSPAAPRGGTVVYRSTQRPVARQVIYQRPRSAAPQRAVTVAAPRTQPAAQVDPRFLPQTVSYDSSQKPGTIIIDTNTKYLYYVMGNGQARRYGVGVGKPGFEWAGTHRITRKAEWPQWNPPAEMITRVRLKEGRILPTHMEGGPDNPLGARALYLGSTLYRIHGTNQPWTIGRAVSSGCIRMRNEDVVDLYERSSVGAKVIVI